MPTPRSKSLNTSQRSSGRVRRQPESIYQVAASSPSSRSSPPKSKRKGSATKTKKAQRQAEEEEDDEDIPSSDEEPEEEEEAFEVLSSKAKAKTSGRRRQSAPAAGNVDGGLEIFMAVKKGAALEPVAKEWVRGFFEAGSASLGDLVNFVFCCAGCKENVMDVVSQDVNDFAEEDWETLLELVADHLEANFKPKYPLVDGGVRENGKFRRNLQEWWLRLVEATRRGNKYELAAVTACIEHIATLSSVNVVALRHTATVAGLHIADALVDSVRDVRKRLSPLERQLKAEQKKSDKSKKARALSDQVAELRECRDMMNELIEQVFTGIFVRRYRDSRAKLREDSLEALGGWMYRYPEHLLSDKYLKYFGWSLHDKEATVRLTSLASLRRLYGLEDFAQQLLPFTSRFRQRFLELLHDVDDDVQLEAAKLVHELFSTGLFDEEEEVDGDEVDQAVSRVFDPSASLELRRELVHIILAQYDSFPEAAGQEADVESQSAQQIVDVLDFCKRMVGDSDPSEVAPFVEAMMETPFGEVLCNWTAMTSCLLRDDPDSEILSLVEDGDTPLLVQLFCQALMGLRKATGSGPGGHGGAQSKKKRRGGKGTAEALPDGLALSVHLLGALPDLLGKFQAEPQSLRALLTLPRLIDSSVISNSQQRSNFKALLNRLKDVFVASQDTGVLTSAAGAIKALLVDHARKKDVEALLRDLCADITGRIGAALEGGGAGARRGGKAGKAGKAGKGRKAADTADTEANLEVALEQLAVLGAAVDLENMADLDSVLLPQVSEAVEARATAENFTRCGEATKQGLEVARGLCCAGLRTLFSAVLWPTLHFLDACRDGGDAAGRGAPGPETIVSRRDLLAGSLHRVLAMHLVTHEFEAAVEGLPEELELDDEVLAAVRQTQLEACLIMGDLQTLHKAGLESYDRACELAWIPSAELTILGANFFHATDLRRDAETADSGTAQLGQHQRLAPLEAHIKFLAYNPHHRNRRQAAAVLDFFSEDKESIATPSVKFCHTAIKQASGFAKLLEVQMTTLQTTFKTLVVSAGAPRQDTADDAQDGAGMAEEEEEEEREALRGHGYEKLTTQAKNLAKLLGVGQRKVADQRLPMLNFLKEGVRFACKSGDGFLGFLEAMVPYMNMLDDRLKPRLREYVEEVAGEWRADLAQVQCEDERGALALDTFCSRLFGVAPTLTKGGGGDTMAGKKRRKAHPDLRDEEQDESDPEEEVDDMSGSDEEEGASGRHGVASPRSSSSSPSSRRRGGGRTRRTSASSKRQRLSTASSTLESVAEEDEEDQHQEEEDDGAAELFQDGDEAPGKTAKKQYSGRSRKAKRPAESKTSPRASSPEASRSEEGSTSDDEEDLVPLRDQRSPKSRRLARS